LLQVLQVLRAPQELRELQVPHREPEQARVQARAPEQRSQPASALPLSCSQQLQTLTT
jgi:hypothetical protein